VFRLLVSRPRRAAAPGGVGCDDKRGRVFFQTAPWVIVAPGLAIGLTVLSVSLLGDGLGDLADPRRARP